VDKKAEKLTLLRASIGISSMSQRGPTVYYLYPIDQWERLCETLFERILVPGGKPVFAKTLKGSDTMRKQMPNAKTLQQQLAETLAENERLKKEAAAAALSHAAKSGAVAAALSHAAFEMVKTAHDLKSTAKDRSLMFNQLVRAAAKFMEEIGDLVKEENN